MHTTFPAAVSAIRHDDTCGSFLAQLITALERGLPYVRAKDARRLATMLCELSNWTVTENARGNAPVARVADLQVWALDECVDGWLRQNWEPAFHAYAALEAAWFLEAQFWGYRELRPDAPAWELIGCVPPLVRALSRGGEKFNVLNDPRFKKQFTTDYGHFLVECEVPPGGCVTLHKFGHERAEVVIPEGTRFRFGIDRCPLSDPPWPPVVRTSSQITRSSELDLCSDFCASGPILPPHVIGEETTLAEIPLSWVVAAATKPVSVLNEQPQPLPAWSGRR